MLQDIAPHHFHNEYKSNTMKEEDIVLSFRDNCILRKKESECIFPTVGEWKQRDGLQYLFRIDGIQYFLHKAGNDSRECSDYLADAEYVPVKSLRETASQLDCFAAATAYHLFVWYRDNRFCGRCGHLLSIDGKERMLYCKECHNMVYPRIAPAVIVGLIHNNRILMTKYAGRDYKKYALIAGFTEIGETAEETVAREVMEEVGLKVKNVTYYKSQPWGFDGNLLMGFFAKLDGADTIVRDESELAVAEWIPREQAANMNDGISLTREMMECFYQKGEENLFS